MEPKVPSAALRQLHREMDTTATTLARAQKRRATATRFEAILARKRLSRELQRLEQRILAMRMRPQA